MKLHFLVGVLLIPILSYAQNYPVKFGKVNAKAFQQEFTEKDTSAGATFLFDVGNVYFTYVQDKGFQISYEHYAMVKIISSEGYKWANIKEVIYHDIDGKESLTGIKGITYNLENGKVVSSKLKQDGIFRESLSDHRDEVSFTMPNVKEGSIIEYKYLIKTDFFMNLPSWDFQKEIPVKHSEVTYMLPEYFKYNKHFTGFLSPQSETTYQPGHITFMHKQTTGGRNPQTSYSTSQVNYQNTVYHWTLNNVDPLENEKYVNSIKNYISSVYFELAQVKMPYENVQNVTQTWEAINKKLMDHEYFGYQLKNTGVVKDMVEAINIAAGTPSEKMVAAHQMIAQKIKWNNSVALFSNGVRKAVNSGFGNSADINLTLVMLLNELGITAKPVVLSTRKNGLIHLSHPTVTSFNHVVVIAYIEDGYYLLDGTQPLCPVGMLPSYCLNEYGRVISETDSDWININDNSLSKSIVSYDLSISDNSFKGTLKTSKSNHLAMEMRLTLQPMEDYDKFIKDIEEANTGLVIGDFSFENIEKFYEDIKADYEIEIDGFVQSLGDFIYIDPLLFEKIDENPFLQEERMYPVDYNYPQEKTSVIKITIPEGYEVETLPENIRLVLPNKDAIFMYQISAIGNTIQIMNKLTIKNTIYLPDDYGNLKAFYSQIVQKHSEQIVLKKSVQ